MNSEIKMTYLMYSIIKLKESIENKTFNFRCRKRKKNFIRNRKLTPKDLVYYTLNNRGKTVKMELFFRQEYNIDEVSTAALLKQREKLNKESMQRFYGEVKTYKGYIIAAIDGSDCEVPNTPETRIIYKPVTSENDQRVARIKLSNCYDVLNKYVLDTRVERYKEGEFFLVMNI
mgnify:CR=1 FL=1